MGSTAEAKPGSLRPAVAYLQTLELPSSFLCSPLWDTYPWLKGAGLVGKEGDALARHPG